MLKNSQLKEKLPEANNISFEYRKESDRVLENLSSGKNSSGSLPSNFKDAIDAIEKYLDDNNPDKFVNFLLSKVEVIRTEVPPKTDLNHYFEIMNKIDYYWYIILLVKEKTIEKRKRKAS